MTCGCGNPLKLGETYLVEGQAQCKSCMLDAIDCKVPVSVRKVDYWEAKNDHRSAS